MVNDLVDSTEQIQAAIDALGGATSGVAGGYLTVPRGEYRITRPLQFRHWSGYFLGEGVGNSPQWQHSPGNGTVLRWDGPPGQPMVKLDNCRNLFFSNMRFAGGANQPSYCVEMSAENIGHGANQVIGFESCWFGRYPWSSQGLHRGDVIGGIGFTGPNRMNDKFRINNCMFRHCDVGIDLPNTQSIWGSVNDSIFDHCGVGVRTSSTMTMYNGQWNSCGVDLSIDSSARVTVFGGYSERCRQMAKLGFDSYLSVVGGLWQVGTVQEHGGILVDMYPSRRASLRLDGVQFTQLTNPARARIRVGGERSTGSVGNWLIDIAECEGIVPEQIDIMPDSFWAQVPLSRGRVSWKSRTATDQFLFQNILQRGGRTRINSSRWDTSAEVLTDRLESWT